MEQRERADQLSEAETGMIQDTWGRVYENCEDVGVAILIRYFLRLFLNVLCLCLSAGKSDHYLMPACTLIQTLPFVL